MSSCKNFAAWLGYNQVWFLLMTLALAAVHATVVTGTLASAVGVRLAGELGLLTLGALVFIPWIVVRQRHQTHEGDVVDLSRVVDVGSGMLGRAMKDIARLNAELREERARLEDLRGVLGARATTHWLLAVYGGVDIVLHGPFMTDESRDDEARAMHGSLDNDDVLFWLDCPHGQAPNVGSYCASFFDTDTVADGAPSAKG